LIDWKGHLRDFFLVLSNTFCKGEMGNLSRTLEKYFPSKIFFVARLGKSRNGLGKMMDSEGKKTLVYRMWLLSQE